MKKVVLSLLVILSACCASLALVMYLQLTPIITRATFTPKTTFAVELTEKNGTCVTESNSSDWKAIAVCTNDRCGKERQRTGGDKTPKGGFVFALNYYDQQISALRRLSNLQCWAAQHSMGVVEPFLIQETRLGVSLAPEVAEHMPKSKKLKFSDIYDIQQWNGKTSIPLTSWNSFLDSAPRDVILVRMKLKNRRSKLHVPCSTDSVVEKQVFEFLDQHKFRVCKKICLDLHRYNHEVSSEHLSDIIFGEARDLKVTVVIAMWVGLRVGGNFVCPAGRFYHKLNPSSGVISDGKEYVRRWLNGSDYIAVVLRFEKILTSGKSVPAVLDKALKLWTLLKSKMKCNAIFLSLDVGRFGSKDLSKIGPKNTAYAKKSAQTFFHKIYSNSSSFDAWEETFVNVSGTTESSYISALQTSIAAAARCVILVGGGEFQSRILQLHKDRHRTIPCHYLL